MRPAPQPGGDWGEADALTGPTSDDGVSTVDKPDDDLLARLETIIGRRRLSPQAVATELRHRGVDSAPNLETILAHSNRFRVDANGRWSIQETPEVKVSRRTLGTLSPSGSWIPLPDWAQFLLEVGSTAARTRGTWSWVVSLPTRSYAAVLIATGFVIATAREGGSSRGGAAWFRQLAALPKGTSVTIRDGERLTKAVFDGVRTENGNKYLVLQARSETRLIPVGECVRVTPRRSTASASTGTIRLADRTFLKPLLNRVEPLDFMRRSKLQCLICGGVNDVRAESLDATFAALSGSTAIRGRLQSVIRIARLVGQQGHFRSDLVAAGETYDDNLGQPAVVIHNGADAYVRRARFDNVPEIALIGRSDRQMETALSLVLTAYSQRRGDLQVLAPPPSTGIDQIVFFEDSR